MKNTYILLSLILIFAGCKQPEPNPHSSDYIYQQVKGEIAAIEAKLAEKKGEFEEFTRRQNEPTMPVLKKKSLRLKAAAAKHEMVKLEQQIKYWKLKLLSREEMVRKAYLSSFNKGEAWDNSAEETQQFKHAQERLHNRNPAGASKEASEKPPEKASGGH